nr:tigger transposable element-derived protein 2-like [Onthophagus taurus]
MAEKPKKVVKWRIKKADVFTIWDWGNNSARCFKAKRKVIGFCNSFKQCFWNEKTKNNEEIHVDAALAERLAQERSEGTPVSGPNIAAKAKVFFDLLELEGNFDASSGWLHRFKKRYGIREIGLHGEKLSGDQQAADEFQRDFEKFVMSEDLSPEQIYNADESGLFWKCLPTHTLAFESEHKAAGHKSSKERITILPCSNAAGTHKLKLLVIGKSKKPRSFKGTRADNLPVDYFNQKKRLDEPADFSRMVP